MDIGTKVRINANYLKKYLPFENFERHKEFNVIGTVSNRYIVDGLDFYQIFWDDGKIESGYNRDFLQELCDINMLLKEIL